MFALDLVDGFRVQFAPVIRAPDGTEWPVDVTTTTPDVLVASVARSMVSDLLEGFTDLSLQDASACVKDGAGREVVFAVFVTDEPIMRPFTPDPPKPKNKLLARFRRTISPLQYHYDEPPPSTEPKLSAVGYTPRPKLTVHFTEQTSSIALPPRTTIRGPRFNTGRTVGAAAYHSDRTRPGPADFALVDLPATERITYDGERLHVIGEFIRFPSLELLEWCSLALTAVAELTGS